MRSAAIQDARRKLRRHSIVVLGVLLTVVFNLDLGQPVVAVTPVSNPLRVVEFTPRPEIQQPVKRGTTSVRNTRARTPISSPTPEPTPLPTPVPPTEGWKGYIFPPTSKTLAPVPIVTGIIQWPVVGVVTQYYSSWHKAVDIATNCGTAVIASDGGAVSWVGWRNNGGGLVVEIDHGWSITGYNHLSSIAVRAGQVVTKGQVIAFVGTTGNSTGCHLHWTLFINGFLNPLAYLP